MPRYSAARGGCRCSDRSTQLRQVPLAPPRHCATLDILPLVYVQLQLCRAAVHFFSHHRQIRRRLRSQSQCRHKPLPSCHLQPLACDILSYQHQRVACLQYCRSRIAAVWSAVQTGFCPGGGTRWPKAAGPAAHNPRGQAQLPPRQPEFPLCSRPAGTRRTGAKPRRTEFGVDKRRRADRHSQQPAVAVGLTLVLD